MKSKPILFSTPMVQAILEGKKTQTRRVVKPQPKVLETETVYEVSKNDWWIGQLHNFPNITHFSGHSSSRFSCPYGKIGDVLWVRETFRIKHPWGHEAFGYYEYKTHNNNQEIKAPDSSVFQSSPKWKPSIFMPKDAARIWLRITDIKIQKLHDISRGDSMSEGCPFPNIAKETNPFAWFSELWQSINGSLSWNSNPFVWVIEFERIEKPTENV